VKELKQFEAETGWKLRVLLNMTVLWFGFKSFWDWMISLLLVADSRGSNNSPAFNVGDASATAYFLGKLQTRYGNLLCSEGEEQRRSAIIRRSVACLSQGWLPVLSRTPRAMDSYGTSILGGIVVDSRNQPLGQIFCLAMGFLLPAGHLIYC